MSIYYWLNNQVLLPLIESGQFRGGPIGQRVSTQRQPFSRKKLQSQNLFTKHLTGGFVMYML
jgi:hypothetical protein